MRPELKSSGEEKGGEGREKAVGLCVVVFEVLVAAVDASGCASLSSQWLPPPPMPCYVVAHQVHPATIERNPKA